MLVRMVAVTKSVIYQNIKTICTEQNLTVSQVEEDTGIPKGSLANWDNERRWSIYLPLVAKRLGVSIDYLFYAKDSLNKSAIERVKSALDTMPIDDDSADMIISISKIITNKLSHNEN